MLKSLAAALLVGLALFGVGHALAQTDPATAELLMRESGLSKQLDSVGPQARAGIRNALAQSGRSVSRKEAERIAAVADEAFEGARLRSIAQSAIARRTKQGHVAALLAWMRSPTGAALTRLEEEAVANVRDPAVALREDSALLATLPAKRQALLRQLAQVTRAGEATATVVINMMAAVQLGVASSMPREIAPKAGDIRRSLEQQRPRMTSAMNGMAVASAAKVYERVSDADLATYIAFLRTPAGVHFVDVTLRAIDEALVDAATRLGRTMPGAKTPART